MDILNSYGVKLSHTLQTKLDTHLVLPGRSSGVTPDDLQQSLNLLQLDVEPEMILLLKKPMTWKMLNEIFEDLQLFLQPINPQLEFLIYFHVHNSEMFSKHLKSQIAKLSTNPEPVEGSDVLFTMPPAVGTQQSTDPDEKLLQVTSICTCYTTLAYV